LEIADLIRRYTADVAVGPISFSVREGEFFSLLGPSGCGKTTTLRCIAGFENVDSGAILLSGQRIDSVPPHKRGIGLVFQTPALFPHLTVQENVAFGLEAHKVPKDEIVQRVGAVLELSGLSNFGQRMPHQLSGGQQQRVALARSLVLEPPLLLLDEPLSSLDLKLRIQMREELRNLQRRLRKTTVFVTHDQTEALAMSDRVAVLSQGHIEQIGTPEEIYSTPISRFVAEFIGSSNLLHVEVVGFSNGHLDLATAAGLRLKTRSPRMPIATKATALIRPERIRLVLGTGAAASPANTFAGEVRDMTYLGEDVHYRVLASQSEMFLVSTNSGKPNSPVVGQERILVHIDPNDVFLLTK
jgi:spermidine/putrescine ABC transporter ATP-binding subunit